MKNMKVAVLVFPGVELQDFAGPIEVFTNASQFGEINFEVLTCGIKSRWMYTENKTVKLKPVLLSSVKDADIFVIPGAFPNVILRLIKDQKFIKKAILSMKNSPHIMSVCTGAFLLAQSGLLDGLSATTHYLLAQKFEELFDNAKTPKKNRVQLIRNVRYVDHGHLLTTSGITSGIDGALHLLSKLTNANTAKRVAEFMQYVPHQKENWPALKD